MKHINKFNQFIIESYGHNQSINWDLINTAKELALEYLDEGNSLRYMVYYKQPDTPTPGPFEVLDGTFSHNGDTFDWNEAYFDVDEVFDSENLFYIIWLPTIEENKKINDLLTFQLREIYPNENIK
jgi:hypothetical protein